jgi:hypothetical protein
MEDAITNAVAQIHSPQLTAYFSSQHGGRIPTAIAQAQGSARNLARPLEQR